MIVDFIRNDERYTMVHPRLIDAFSFLKRSDLAHLQDGRYDIEGVRITATIARAAGRGKAGAVLESHKKFIDIQFSIAGTDVIGWKERRRCETVREAYDREKDCILYADEADSWISLSPGAFAIFFTDDAHAPLCGTGDLRKVVVKVSVD